MFAKNIRTMEKVFCIGMFKTGTTSIGHKFDILDYKTLHNPWRPEGIMIRDDFFKFIMETETKTIILIISYTGKNSPSNCGINPG